MVNYLTKFKKNRFYIKKNDKPKMLHTRYRWHSRFVQIFTAKARLCTVVLLLVLYFTTLFNPSVQSPSNHIAKTVSATPTTGYQPRDVRFWSEGEAVK